MWTDMSRWLLAHEHVFTFLTTILWFLYVLYTIRTFRQIKAQTDLQTKAFLSISIDSESKYGDPIDLLADQFKKAYVTWEGIISKNAPEAPALSTQLGLILINAGASGIAEWKIHMSMKVTPGEYLQHVAKTSDDEVSWTVQSNAAETLSANQPEGIYVCVASLGPFPHADLAWSVEYTDTRGEKYTEFSGPAGHTHKNSLIFDRQVPASAEEGGH